MASSHICVLLVLAAASASAGSWVDDPSLKSTAEARKQVSIPRVSVDLDAHPRDRWVAIGKSYQSNVPAVLDYLNSMLPKWALPIVERVGADLEGYFGDYGLEMEGAAEGLGMKLGDVVVLNLVYQLESLGLNCSNWNDTGPTRKDDPGCMDVDPTQKWCYCHTHRHRIQADGALFPPPAEGPGLCTSVVAADEEGRVFHGRNLDWNLDPALLALAVDVDFKANGSTVYTGTTLVGFVGVLNGMRQHGWSGSIDARGKGGKLLDNIMAALLHHGATPVQHLRTVLAEAATYDEALKELSHGALVDEVYYTVAGAGAYEGAVVSRGRAEADDTWALNRTGGWYRLETNYDHWNPVPTADDRRTPGYAHMEALGQQHVGVGGMMGIMRAWPTYNYHTDYTGIFAPFNNTYVSSVWL